MNESLKTEFSFEESGFGLVLVGGSEIWQKYNQSSSEDRQEKKAFQKYTKHTDFSRVLVTADLHMVQHIEYPTAPGFCVWSKAVMLGGCVGGGYIM